MYYCTGSNQNYFLKENISFPPSTPRFFWGTKPFHFILPRAKFEGIKRTVAIEILNLKQFNHTQQFYLLLFFFFPSNETHLDLQIFCNEAMQNHCLVMQMKRELTEKHSGEHESFAKTQSEKFYCQSKFTNISKLAFMHVHC